MERTTHRVTCKIALFDQERKNVLLAEYNKGNFGLPGGHLEKNETPDEAILRELFEEINIIYDGPLIRKDFWLHDNGKLILGYIGELDKSTIFKVDTKEMTEVKWTPVEDIRIGKLSTGSYDSFILDNCEKYINAPT